MRGTRPAPGTAVDGFDGAGDEERGFEEHRAHLRSVAYRMLGSLTEAEDAVQEAWLRLSRADTGDVRDLRAWLTTVVSRVCLDMLRSRAVPPRGLRSDVHVPDPIVTPADDDPPSTRCWPTRSASRCWSCSTRCRPPSGWRSCCTTSSPCRSSRSARSWTARRPPPSSWRAGPGSGCAAAGPQPGAEPGAAAGRAARPGPRRRDRRPRPGSGPWSTPSSPRRARATSTRLLAILDPDVVLRADAGAGPLGPSSLVRGAAERDRAGPALRAARPLRPPGPRQRRARFPGGPRRRAARAAGRDRAAAAGSPRWTSSPTRIGWPGWTWPPCCPDRDGQGAVRETPASVRVDTEGAMPRRPRNPSRARSRRDAGRAASTPASRASSPAV